MQENLVKLRIPPSTVNSCPFFDTCRHSPLAGFISFIQSSPDGATSNIWWAPPCFEYNKTGFLIDDISWQNVFYQTPARICNYV